MESNRPKIFAQYIANLLGGASFALLSLMITITKICWDCPSYGIVILIAISSIGIIITEIITRKYQHTFYLVNLGAFITIFLLFLIYIGIEDWTFVGGLALGSIGLAIIPAMVLTVTIHWQKFLKPKK
ncbi:MAG: hypothetical protein HYY51_00040 [Candidatus Magasanikbacteria bacterium]|nr:hypothetical protein [Candidatus Magasanikbacteria bacterium]